MAEGFNRIGERLAALEAAARKSLAEARDAAETLRRTTSAIADARKELAAAQDRARRSAALAADAALRVHVDWEPLPSVTVTRAAVGSGAPVLWDRLGGNVCVDSLAGDARAADAAFAAAAHVVRLDTWVPRITGVPMEPRAALGVHDAATGRYTLYAGSGGSVRLKTDLAEVLGVPEASVRVVAQDVGGNYGTRNSSYPEYPLVAWAARRLGRPVKWTGDRREMFLSDYQARDLVSTMELALDADGTFLALRGTIPTALSIEARKHSAPCFQIEAPIRTTENSATASPADAERPTVNRLPPSHEAALRGVGYNMQTLEFLTPDRQRAISGCWMKCSLNYRNTRPINASNC